MRDVEFLPTWYPALGRRKLALKTQTWIALGVLLALSSIALAQCWQVRRQEETLVRIGNQLALSDRQVSRLKELQKQEQTLARQQRQIVQLGLHMPTTGLLNELEDALPEQISLVGLTIDPQESAGERIRLTGVSPNDEQVAVLLTKLGAMRCFENVDMSYVRDRVQQGRLMREFEITFALKAGAS